MWLHPHLHCIVPGGGITKSGKWKNARYKDDDRPPEPGCDCPTCSRHSRAYLRHLLHIDETLGARLATLHNLRFYLRLLEEVREAIRLGRFEELRKKIHETLAR